MTLEQYQDIWVNGKVKEPGIRDCGLRWEMIKPQLDRWKRPFTVLDFGANLGYYSLRLVEEYDCTVVAVESIYTDWLMNVLNENKQDRVILLDKKFTLQDIQALSEVEHFDLVLALSVMHHVEGGTYEEILEAFASLGDVMISEIALEGPACGQNIVKDAYVPKNAKVLGKPKSHLDGSERILFVSEHRKRTLAKSYIGTPLRDTALDIHSDYYHKDYVKSGAVRQWWRGINLKTWMEMGGIRPSVDEIVEMCEKEKPDFMKGDMIHGDLAVHNVILQGDGVKFIDSLDVRRHVEVDDDWFDKMINEIKESRS